MNPEQNGFWDISKENIKTKNEETNLAEELADDLLKGSSELSWEKSIDNRIDGRVTIAKPVMRGFTSSWPNQGKVGIKKSHQKKTEKRRSGTQSTQAALKWKISVVSEVYFCQA